MAIDNIDAEIEAGICAGVVNEGLLFRWVQVGVDYHVLSDGDWSGISDNHKIFVDCGWAFDCDQIVAVIAIVSSIFLGLHL